MGRKKTEGNGSAAPAMTAEQRQEAKRARFLNLAEKRVNNALLRIVNVGRMANRQNYVYTEEEGTAIVRALENAVADVKRSFSSGPAAKPRWTLG